MSKTILMDFPEAMEQVIMGNKIHKLEWLDEQIYGCLKDGFLTLHLADGTDRKWLVSDGDLMGEDYIII